MKKLKLNIKGMHCASCDALVKDILEDFECENISVSFKTGVMTCEYDESKTNIEEIKKELADAGHTATTGEADE